MGREFRLLWQDPFSRALMSWVPLLLMGILCWIFSAGLARDLKVGLVDLDHSVLSRQLAFSLDGSAGLKVAQQFDSIDAGARALRGGDIYALVVIPNHLERDARQGTQPQVTVFNNGQFILIAKLVNSALAQVVGTLNGQVGVLEAMADGKALPGALGQSVPISSQVTALYNLNSSYAQFLLSAILPAVWQILVVLFGLNALARTDRLGLDWTTRGVWFGLWRTLLPHVLIGWGWGIVWTLLLFRGFSYPMHGSWLVLLVGLGLASAACVTMGAFFLRHHSGSGPRPVAGGGLHCARFCLYGGHLSGERHGGFRPLLAQPVAGLSLCGAADWSEQLWSAPRIGAAATGGAAAVPAPPAAGGTPLQAAGRAGPSISRSGERRKGA